MKYPRRSPYLVYRRTGKCRYEIEDFLYDEIWLLDRMEMAILRSLDGKHDPDKLLPEYSREDVQQTLIEFKESNLLAPRKKIRFHGIGSFSFPLIYCYPGKWIKFFAKVYNFLLMTLFLPIFIHGLYISKSDIFDIYAQSKGELIAAILLGAFVGIALHELSHAFAALAYGGNVFEMGIGALYFLPIGYVLMKFDNVGNRMKRIQIHAAGIEMNLLLCGLFMLIKHHFICSFITEFLIPANLVIAVLNILPLDGHDGLSILSTLFKKDDLLEYAKCLISESWHGKTPRSLKAFAAVAASCCLVGIQILIPLLSIAEGYSILKLIFWY